MQRKNRQLMYTNPILEAFAHMLKTTAVYTQLSSFVARRNLAGSPAQSQNFSINQMRTAIASPSARNDGCAWGLIYKKSLSGAPLQFLLHAKIERLCNCHCRVRTVTERSRSDRGVIFGRAYNIRHCEERSDEATFFSQ